MTVDYHVFGQFLVDLGCEPESPYDMDNPEGSHELRCPAGDVTATRYKYYDCFLAEGKE